MDLLCEEKADKWRRFKTQAHHLQEGEPGTFLPSLSTPRVLEICVGFPEAVLTLFFLSSLRMNSCAASMGPRCCKRGKSRRRNLRRVPLTKQPMKTNKLILCGGLAGLITATAFESYAELPASAPSANAAITWTTGGKQSKNVDVLFVQNAKNVTMEKGSSSCGG